MHHLLNAVEPSCLLFFSFSLLLQGTSEPSCALSLSYLKLVCRRLEIYHTGPGDCTAASLGSGINMFWTSCGSHLATSGSSAPVFASVHPSRCSDRPVQGMNLLCFLSFLHCLCVAVFCHRISAATSTFMSMYCTCGNFNGLCTLWT